MPRETYAEGHSHPSPDQTLVGALLHTIDAHPGKGITHVLAGGRETSHSYADLLADAEVLLAGFRALGLRPLDPVMLVFGWTRPFLATFWGSVLGGFLPVPLAPPETGRALEPFFARTQRLHEQLGRPVVVTEPGCKRLLRGAGAGDRCRGWTIVTPGELRDGRTRDSAWTPSAPDEIAFVQHSSGSTGDPKGVGLTHQNLLHDMQAMLERGEGAAEDVFVSWMPLYHDMGLIGYHLTPILSGSRQVLIRPVDFARRPLVWLQKLTSHRGTVTCSPNFGYRHTLRHLARADLKDLDLTSVRLVLNGAEPIAAKVMDDFLAALAPAGLRPGAMCPAYGLSEGSLAVAMCERGARRAAPVYDRRTLRAGARPEETEADHPDATVLVDLGPPVSGCEIKIADAEDRFAPEGVVGTIKIRGPNVTSGYYRDPDATRAVLSGGWLDTGDLGFLQGGHLVVTGRVKDVIFAMGRTLHAHDLEASLADLDGVVPGRVAVIGTTDPETRLERVIVFLRPRPAPPRTRLDVVVAVRERLGEVLGLPVAHVIPIQAAALPRTSSGKLRRGALKEAFERGDFDEARQEIEETLARGRVSRASGGASGPASGGGYLDDVLALCARVLQRPASEIDPDRSLLDLGGDSLGAIELHGLLETRYRVFLDPEILRRCRTAREMATFLERRLARKESSPAPPARAAPPPVPVPASLPASAEPSAPRWTGREVAIIGMALRLPGADSPEAFWELLRRGRCMVREVPPDRWDTGRYYDPDPGTPGKTSCRFGAFLADVRSFDPQAFGLTDEQALDTDPQQRLLLEVAAEVLDQAGHGRRNVGVFVGAGGNDYFHAHVRDLRLIRPFTAVGNLAHMPAAFVSQVFDLTGPSLTINAACATSQVAVHLAAQSLLRGECELAIAGGVELNLTVVPYLLFSQSQLLSPRGRCEPFGSGADGFVPGEGAGAVLLKPLARALAEGDPILGVLKGSGVNNDGRALSVMAPNPAGQRAVLEKTYAAAGVSPGTVTYIEAHGAGTPLGDPIEVRSLTQVFEAHTDRKGGIGIGSVKSNLGHLFHATGIAALCKVLLSLRHREIPPTLGCEAPNPALRFPRTPFRPVRALTRWTVPEGAIRRAGINGFGVGGTNCHLVVEEAPSRPPSPSPAAPPPRDASLLCLSARDEGDLRRVAASFADVIEARPSTRREDLCASANARAYRFETRRAFPVTSLADAGEKLRDLQGGTRSLRASRLVFVFAGPGSQHPGMGRHLFEGEPVFRDALAACGAILGDRLGRPLEELLFAEPDLAERAMNRIDVAQPIVFSFGYALARWLMSLGLEPDAVIGHSAGEYAAACLAGALSLRDALEIVLARGVAMRETEPGRMVAVFAGQPRVEPHLAGLGERIGFAALNEPDQVVLSGSDEAVARALESLARAGIAFRELPISCAAHSPLMRPAREALRAALAGRDARAPRIPVYSTVTAGRVSALGPAYWLRHLERPVRFAAAVRAARDDGFETFLEVGATATLTHCMTQTLAPSKRAVRALPTMRRSLPGWGPTLASFAALFELGHRLRLDRLRHGVTELVYLPPYPYRRRRFWLGDPVEAPAPAPSRTGQDSPMQHRLVLEDQPIIAGHRAHGQAIAPAGLLIRWALAAARQEAPGSGLGDLLLGRPLELGAGSPRVATVHLAKGDGPAPSFRVTSRAADGGAQKVTHLIGTVETAPPSRPPRVDLEAVKRRCPEEVPARKLYRHLGESGLRYGPALRGVTGLRVGPGEVLGWLSAPPRLLGTAEAEDQDNRFAALVDAGMQSIGGLTLGFLADRGFTFLGFAIRSVHVYDSLAKVRCCRVALVSPLREETRSFRCNLDLLDADGAPVARFCEVALKALPRPRSTRFYALDWTPSPPATQPRSDLAGARVAVLGSSSETVRAVSARLEAAGLVVEDALLPPDGGDGDGLLRRLGPSDRLVSVEPQVASLLLLSQALLRNRVTALSDFLVVSSSSPPLAFHQVVAEEHAAWSCRGIEIRGAGLGPEDVAEAVASELRGPHEAFRVLYRDGARFLPRLAEVELGSARSPLRDEGVYWIVGGAGGLGLAVAKLLASDLGARLLITGRREEAPPAILEDIEALGGRAIYLRADVTDLDEMRRARDAVLETWGRLDGVVHAAGLLDDGLVAHYAPARLRALERPKIDGSRVLVEILAERTLDFLVFFSSLASLLGSPGQAAYAAANAFLDDLAGAAPLGECRVLAVSWGPWKEVGMLRASATVARLEGLGFRPFSPDEGARAFAQALSSTASQVVAVGLDPEREATLRAWYNRVQPGAGAAAPRKPVAVAPAGAGGGRPARKEKRMSSKAAVLDFLVHELALELRRADEDVDAHTPFQRLGVDSLMAVKLVKTVEAHYDIQLYPTLLFEHDTLAKVSDFLTREYGLGRGRAMLASPVAAPAATSAEVAGEPVACSREVEAYRVGQPGGGADLVLSMVPLRDPGPDEVEIEVRAIGVNFIDLLASVGMHPNLGERSFVLGHEVSGVVAAVGDDVSAPQVGQRVMAVADQGGYARSVVVPAAAVRPLPETVSFEEGAGSLIAGMTAIACLEHYGRLEPGERVLVQAAAGATGLACVQLAVHTGAVVFGTAGSEEKLELLRSLGVAHPIHYREVDFAEVIRDVTHGEGVDVVVDSLSGEAITKGLSILRPGGRFLEIGAAGVVEVPAIDPAALFRANQAFIGVNLGRLRDDPRLFARIYGRLEALVEQGVLRPHLGARFDFRDAAAAHRLIRERKNIGKVVLRVG